MKEGCVDGRVYCSVRGRLAASRALRECCGRKGNGGESAFAEVARLRVSLPCSTSLLTQSTLE